MVKIVLRNYIHEQRTLWSMDMVLDIAKTYSKMNDFKKNEPRAYNAARRNGWIEEVRKLMTNAYEDWSDLEKIYKEALKYETLKDFREKSPKAYSAAKNKDILDDLKQQLKPTPSSKPTLTPEDVAKEASKYTTKKEFRSQSPLAYRWAIEYGLFGTSIHHLGQKQNRKPSGYWDYEKLKAEAFKYKTKKEFSEKNKGAVSTAKKMGIWDEITSHMVNLGNLSKRAVYAWEFPDKSVYVGLTYNLEMRGLQHLDEEGKTQVSKHIKLTKTVPLFKLLSDYVPPQEAQNLESCSIEEYKNNGWKILNKAKAGGLGTCRRKWTDEEIFKVAKKFDNVSDFKKFAHSAYVSAQKYGIFDEVTKDMKRFRETFTDDEIRNVASKYKRKDLFKKNEPKIVQAARARGIYDDLVKNMEKSPHDTSDYIPPTKDEVLSIAKQFNSMKSFREQHPDLYGFAYKNDLLHQIRDFYGKTFTKWDFEKLKDVSKNYTSRFDFQKGNASAYQSARRQGFLDILFPKQD